MHKLVNLNHYFVQKNKCYYCISREDDMHADAVGRLDRYTRLTMEMPRGESVNDLIVCAKTGTQFPVIYRELSSRH